MTILPLTSSRTTLVKSGTLAPVTQRTPSSASTQTVAAPSPVTPVPLSQPEKAIAGKVEWKEPLYKDVAIAGVFNPNTGKVEWKEGLYKDVAIAGVFNPNTGKVEWKEPLYKDVAIAGVFNPNTGKAEWKEGRSKNIAIAGVFVPGGAEFESDREY